ncbi:MAG: hypothetical protein JO104_05310 [Candidatus Eremiobacteraeota bacterium]|nr:hypothetical protein [Candidatus Eremiobacteraeota bacterium]
MKLYRQVSLAALSAAAAISFAGCGGGTLPSGPVVNSPGGSDPPPTHLVKVKVEVTVPSGTGHRVRPGYVSVNTRSLTIQLSSVDGQGVTGVNATTINTDARARGCKPTSQGLLCTATTDGSPGDDLFAVTTYASTNATGALLSVGTVQAKIASGGGGIPISNKLSLTLRGVIAALGLSISPHGAKRGTPTKAAVTLIAYDATGAQIVGPSDFSGAVVLTIQGDVQNAFALHAGGKSGTTLDIEKPTLQITLAYDGNAGASPVTVEAVADGPGSITKSAPFALHGKTPPPPVGTIYALNLGANDGLGATVTEYGGKAKGNAVPERTLQLSSKLYARGIAVDSSGNLYVGYFDNQYGFSPSNGTPDARNQIAIYAPNAAGNAKPKALLTADRKTHTALYPQYMTFDASGDLVTYGATSIDGNSGSDAVLTYPVGSTGAASPASGFNFATPRVTYAGPTGLALDASGNFYVSGALYTTLGSTYGTFVAAASDAGNPNANVAREIPWGNSGSLQTQLNPYTTSNLALNGSGEIFIANNAPTGSGSSLSCQGRANVFAAGAGGGITNVPPLRVITFEGVYSTNPLCESSRNPLTQFFPSISMYATTLFVADDLNNAIDAFNANAKGLVKPALRIAGSATGLNAPIALVITSSGAVPR